MGNVYDALMCLSRGVAFDKSVAGAPYVQQALANTFGIVGPVFIAAAMVLFAFTTLLGNFYYVEVCIAYIFGRMPGKATLNIVRIIGGVLFSERHCRWISPGGIADVAQCVLAFINIPVCIIIGSVVYLALKNYTAQRKKRYSTGVYRRR